MENMFNDILKRIDTLFTNSKFIRRIKFAAVCALTVICCAAVRGCRDARSEMRANMVAMTDTISYYKGKSGRLVAQKTMLEGDMATLKLTNDSLYNIIKDMKVKTPDNAARIVTIIEGGRIDTCWALAHDTVWRETRSVSRDFDFSDEWRTVRGTTYLHDDTLGTVITKNDARADFTVVQKDNNVYITSNNPYIKYKSITAITMKKQKRWHIGPFVGVGVTHKLEVRPVIGIGLQYSVFGF